MQYIQIMFTKRECIWSFYQILCKYLKQMVNQLIKQQQKLEVVFVYAYTLLTWLYLNKTLHYTWPVYMSMFSTYGKILFVI